MRSLHRETHLVSRIGRLGAAVLGANDGIVSTASLIVGVAASAAGSSEILIAGVTGLLVAGAMMPLAMVWLAPTNQLVLLVSAASLLFLALLGAIGAKAGGASVLKATIRVTF